MVGGRRAAEYSDDKVVNNCRCTAVKVRGTYIIFMGVVQFVNGRLQHLLADVRHGKIERVQRREGRAFRGRNESRQRWSHRYKYKPGDQVMGGYR